jgi:hypothetical protein
MNGKRILRRGARVAGEDSKQQSSNKLSESDKAPPQVFKVNQNLKKD